MHKKTFAIIAVTLMIMTSLVALVPVSEAKNVSKTFDQDISNNSQKCYGTITINEEFKIDFSSYSGGFLMFENSSGKETEVYNALKNGNIYEVSGMVDITQETFEAGSYVVVCNSGTIFYKVYDSKTQSWEEKTTYVNRYVNTKSQFVSMQLSAGNGDSIKVSINPDELGAIGLGAYVISKRLMVSFDEYTNPINKIKQNMKEVMAYNDDISDGCTLEFKSDNVTDYFVVVLISDPNSSVVHHFTGSIDASGLSNTAGPMPFAIILFIISIGLLAVIIYFGRKKVME